MPLKPAVKAEVEAISTERVETRRQEPKEIPLVDTPSLKEGRWVKKESMVKV